MTKINQTKAKIDAGIINIKLFLCAWFALAFWGVEAHELKADARPRICLNMIVKDESAVIRRCLSSVKNMIDYWVIVDTGSKDGTQQLIREAMRGIPGELHERPWVDFAHNRNEALALAKGKGEYILFIDADEEFFFAPNFLMPRLEKDFYSIIVRQEGIVDSQRILLIKSALDWHWEGVIHEDILSAQAKNYELLQGVINYHHEGGQRSRDPEKYRKDALVLERALGQEPQNSRYVYYLAESYAHCGEYALALKTYERRAQMGGWDQELFWSLYNIGRMQEILGMPQEIVMKSYSKAYAYRPSRAEPLYRLSSYCYRMNQCLLGYLTAQHALTIPLSKDPANVESWIYSYGLLQQLAASAFCLGEYEEAYAICERLLALPDLPEELRTSTQNNLQLVIAKLSQVGRND